MWSLVDWLLSSASRILAMRQFHHLQKFILLAVSNSINFIMVPRAIRGERETHRRGRHGPVRRWSGGCRAPPIRREQGRDFPGKAMAENPPSRAGDVGSVPHAWILCATTEA